MSGIFGPPGLGKVPNVFDEDSGGGSGFVQLNYIGGAVRMLIHSWNYMSSERVQENLTLSETEHIYTFGRALPKLGIVGFVTHDGIVGKNFLDNSTGKSLLRLWEDFLRARKGGESNIPSASVVIDELGSVFEGVAVNMSLNKDLSNEALIAVNFTVIVLEGFE